MTSERYTDYSFITADHGIGEEASNVFQTLAVQKLTEESDRMLVAPLRFKSVLLEEMDRVDVYKRQILKEAGFEVESAEDGEIAVRKMKQAADGQYDLILMDIQLPNMDGYEAVSYTHLCGSYPAHH